MLGSGQKNDKISYNNIFSNKNKQDIHTFNKHCVFLSYLCCQLFYQVIQCILFLYMSYSGIDGAERHHPFNAIGVISTPGLPARVISLFQDELLAIEGSVLKTNPARRSYLETFGDIRRRKEIYSGK